MSIVITCHHAERGYRVNNGKKPFAEYEFWVPVEKRRGWVWLKCQPWVMHRDGVRGWVSDSREALITDTPLIRCRMQVLQLNQVAPVRNLVDARRRVAGLVFKEQGGPALSAGKVPHHVRQGGTQGRGKVT